MSYKDETILDKLWNLRYALIWILWAFIAAVLALAVAALVSPYSLLPAIPVLLVMYGGYLVHKHKILGED